MIRKVANMGTAALLLLGALWLAPAGLAQLVPSTFSVYKTTALSGAAETITIQKPTTSNRKLRFYGASVHCTVACVVTLEVRGTAATSTALTPTALTGAATTATAFHTSNVGSGTTVGTYPVNASDSVVLDLSKIVLDGSLSTENLTIKTDSITGTVRIVVVWEEQS